MSDRIVYAGDFETTVYENQEYTEVWSSALVQLGTDDDPMVFHSIGDTMDFLDKQGRNVTIYYHNLKFDGSFWLSYCMDKLRYKTAVMTSDDDKVEGWISRFEMPKESVCYLVSSTGQWYSMSVRTKKVRITLYDSFKLLPFSVKAIGKNFGTKHQKLEMEYKGYRYAGCPISDEEMEYIKNDVLVMKEALENFFASGHNGITIGTCCLKEFKSIWDNVTDKKLCMGEFKDIFPRLDKIELDKDIYGSSNADEYIRKSYKGGWCYLKPEYSDKLVDGGCTADVNSLYPSMMSSESGNKYPVGTPTFWTGNYIPDKALQDDKYYILRVRTRFKLKHGKLPCIQIKTSWKYKPTEYLTTSDIWNEKTHRYDDKLLDENGNLVTPVVTLTCTQTDWKLMNEHYLLYETEILDGCWFWCYAGLFDDYIEKYKQMKINNKGAKKTLAKLFLNNLYGKLGTSPNSNYKVAYLKDDKSIGWEIVIAKDKTPVYIPCATAITSYARDFTIRHAQENYANFIYADTDSIHCKCKPEELVDIRIHDRNFCCWKIESIWDKAKFLRQKTYIEHVLKDDGTSEYDLKCAGMTKRCKDLFNASVTGEQLETKSKEEEDFLSEKRTIDDFRLGLRIPSKTYSRQIRGGTLLYEDYMEIHE